MGGTEIVEEVDAMDMEALRYPIGRYRPEDPVTDERLAERIADIEALPHRVRGAVEGLADDQLDTPYRPRGWTLRQVVHHLPDSHANAYVRCKWALTEDAPAIKVYDEKAWAELADSRAAPIEPALDLLEGLHAKWVALLRRLSRDELARTFVHPEWGAVALDACIAMYAWHGRHHLAHLTTTIEREGWSA